MITNDKGIVELKHHILREVCRLAWEGRLSAEETEKIIRGDIDWMPASGRPLLVALYADMKTRLLRPKTVVQYMRVPFIYAPGNVRVTIDWDIRTGQPADFLKPDGLTLPVEDNVTLLEVKWDEYLPGVIKRAAARKSREPSAYSKYAACRVWC